MHIKFYQLGELISLLRNHIKIHYSTNYYLQGNGLAESTNKNLIKIVNKTVIENQRNWNVALPNALWDDKVTPKNSLIVLL